LFFGENKPSAFYFSERRSRRHFIVVERTKRRPFISWVEQAIDILFFGKNKPSKVRFSERKPRRSFISRAEDAAEIIFLNDFSGLD
jgi:hypothetical protein